MIITLDDFGFNNPCISKRRYRGVENMTYTQEKTQEKEDKKQPVKKYRNGTVCLTVWENKTKDDKSFYAFSIEASYFDKEANEYKPSKSMSKGQISALKDCITAALLDGIGSR